MSREIRAIYENGLLRPLDPIALSEHDVVSIVVLAGAPPAAPAHETASTAATSQGDGFELGLEGLLFDGPGLPADFSRADIYSDHD
jgi:predicted DNA-binding antitoxin AbrB/MazE fold protein